MPETGTVKTAARLPVDLVESASARARKIDPDASISGILRYAIALLAGLPAEQAREHLNMRPKGHPRAPREKT